MIPYRFVFEEKRSGKTNVNVRSLKKYITNETFFFFSEYYSKYSNTRNVAKTKKKTCSTKKNRFLFKTKPM